MENPLICQILSSMDSFLSKTLDIINLNIETGNIGYIYLILLCFISNPDLFKESMTNIFTLIHFFINPPTGHNISMEYVGVTISTLRRAFLEKRISKDDVEILLNSLKLMGLLTNEDVKQVTL
jgi:hypothetical protein